MLDVFNSISMLIIWISIFLTRQYYELTLLSINLVFYYQKNIHKKSIPLSYENNKDGIFVALNEMEYHHDSLQFFKSKKKR